MLSPIEKTLASTAISTVSGPAKNALVAWGKQKYDKFIVTYTKAFSENVSRSVEKCSKVRNVMYRNDQNANTDEKYVSISFLGQSSKEISDKDIIEKLKSKDKIIIKGIGGAGKTMFTKYAVLRLAESLEHHQQIPIYI